MKVRILRSLVYSDFAGGKVGAKRHEAGEVVDFPAWYAESIVASGHAEPLVEAMPALLIGPEVEVEPRGKRKRSAKKE